MHFLIWGHLPLQIGHFLSVPIYKKIQFYNRKKVTSFKIFILTFSLSPNQHMNNGSVTDCNIGPYLNNDCVCFLKQGPWLTYFILVPVCPVFLLGRRHVEPQVLQHITCPLGPGGIWKAKRLLIVPKIFQDIGQVSFREVCIVKCHRQDERMLTSLFRRQRFYKETL